MLLLFVHLLDVLLVFPVSLTGTVTAKHPLVTFLARALDYHLSVPLHLFTLTSAIRQTPISTPIMSAASTPQIIYPPSDSLLFLHIRYTIPEDLNSTSINALHRSGSHRPRSPVPSSRHTSLYTYSVYPAV